MKTPASLEELTGSVEGTHFCHQVNFEDLPALDLASLTKLGFTPQPKTKVTLLFERAEPLVKEKGKANAKAEEQHNGGDEGSGVSAEESDDDEEVQEVRPRRSFSATQVPVADCFAIHRAIHDKSVKEVKLSTGESVPVQTSSNKCRKVVILGVSFMEQNVNKPSTYAKMAKKGHKITWILQNPRWGMICDDRVEINCPLIDHSAPTEAENNEKENTKKRKTKVEGSETAKAKKGKTEAAGVNEPEEIGDSGASTAKAGVSSHTLNLSVEFPSYWDPPFTDRSEVVVTGKEFNDLKAMFMKTAGPKSEIVEIKRLQHPGLWPHYYLKRKAIQEINEGKPEKVTNMLTKLLDPATNEFYFYHGCSQAVVEKIATGGFDERLASLKGLFGSGIYLADNVTKSLQYTHTATCAQVGAVYTTSQCTCRGQTNAIRSIFIVRSAIGTPWIRYVATDQDNPMRRPPLKPNGVLYDSVVGEAKKNDNLARLEHREIIIYDRQQCFPEYLINFKLV